MALRLLRRDVTFYRFPGEGHELSAAAARPCTECSAPRSCSTGSPSG
jgi:hypothetical protein